MCNVDIKETDESVSIYKILRGGLRPGGGGYLYEVCAAQRGRDFGTTVNNGVSITSGGGYLYEVCAAQRVRDFGTTVHNGVSIFENFPRTCIIFQTLEERAIKIY